MVLFLYLSLIRRRILGREPRIPEIGAGRSLVNLGFLKSDLNVSVGSLGFPKSDLNEAVGRFGFLKPELTAQSSSSLSPDVQHMPRLVHLLRERKRLADAGTFPVAAVGFDGLLVVAP